MKMIKKFKKKNMMKLKDDDAFIKNGNLNFYKPKNNQFINPNNMFRLNKNQNKKPKILIYYPLYYF